jgi:hypothetical protein
MQTTSLSKVDALRPRYTLNELLAQCDPKPKPRRTKEDREWLADKPVGRELI